MTKKRLTKTPMILDKYVLISLIFALVMIFWYISVRNHIFEGFEDVPDVQFPFRNMYDSKGKKLNIILITAPFREEKHEKLYDEYKSSGLLLCGISSYQSFPDKILNPFEDRFHETRGHNYPNMVSAWLHCFRDLPQNLIDSNLPVLLMTEADLKDWKNLPFRTPNVKKEYDFMYVCLQDNDKCNPGWQSYNRNWDLGKKCLKIMCGEMGMKALLVGRENCELGDEIKKNITNIPFMEYHKFQAEMQKCKFLFLPNISDASPRVATEAMCYDMPVLMNYNILGGWHNIIPGITGEFFTDENDLTQSLSRLKRGGYKPKYWYMTNRGRQLSGKILGEFIREVYKDRLNSKDLAYVYIAI